MPPPNKLWLILPSVLWLLGCSTPGPTLPPAGGENWQIKGRVALWQVERSDSASLDWLHCGTRLAINLRGPFGTGGSLRADSSGAALLQHGEPPLRGASAEQLLTQLGWPVPVTELDYWIRGLPAPGQALAIELDEGGRILTLEQADWQLQFSRHVRAGEGWRPNRIDAEKGDTRLRLLVKQVINEPADCAQPGPWLP